MSDLPPRDPTPDERELSRRSRAGSLDPVLVVAVIALIAVVVFVASSL